MAGWIALILVVWMLNYGDDVTLFELIKDKQLSTCVEEPWKDYDEN